MHCKLQNGFVGHGIMDMLEIAAVHKRAVREPSMALPHKRTMNGTTCRWA